MADVKKAAATAKPVAKAVAATKAADVKDVKETVKKEAAPKKEAVAKKAPAKKEAAPKKETAKKAPAKKAATTAKKAEVKASISLQFAGKEYKTEDFVKIAKDVWQYDLGKKVADFKSVELYVKPEENTVYYVINDEVTGNFAI